MTAEPRPAEEIRSPVDIDHLVEQLSVQNFRPIRSELYAALSELRQHRAEVESIWTVVREYLPEAIGHNTLPEIVAGIARQRDGQHEIKDHLADVARKLTEGHKRACYAKLTAEAERDEARGEVERLSAELADARAELSEAQHALGYLLLCHDTASAQASDWLTAWRVAGTAMTHATGYDGPALSAASPTTSPEGATDE